jgi:DNA (cytosine-5)-methyltransferase 1
VNYLSICSGIEAASVAWHPLGWKPFAFSEIEPFPSAVLTHHWPDVPNLGDMTKFDEWGNLHEVDLLVGGTPCQAFSVAGLRKSLDDARGNLSLTYISILNKIDHERSIRLLPPAVCVWENVPGVLNTKDNAFGCFLGGLAGEDLPLLPPGGRWSNAGYVRGPQRTIAWRILDAQYLGVAQRRRRVFVVASARDGFCPEQILFEFDGLRRDSPPSREERKDAASDIEKGFAPGSFGAYELTAPVLANTLQTTCGNYSRADGFSMIALSQNECPLVAFPTEDVIAMRESGQGYWMEDEVATFPLDSQNWGEGHNSGGKGFGEVNDPSFTLTKGHHHGVAYGIDEEQNAAEELMGCIKARQNSGGPQFAVAIPIQDGRGIEKGQNGLGVGSEADPAYTLDQTGAQAVAFAQNSRDELREMDVVGALAANPGMKQTSYLRQGFAVRRLTPTECARLQGFHDDHCRIPWRGKPAEDCPDGPQYKAYGNSMAVPVMRWIGERIDAYLFGGFEI